MEKTRGGGWGRFGCRILGLGMALVFSLPVALWAQSVRGRTVEAGTGRAVEGAQVSLVAADGKVVAEVISGREGAFQLLARSGGRYTLRAGHLAYLTVTSQPFDLADGEELVVDLSLPTAPIPLDPLTITARRVDPRIGSSIEGFYARAKMAGEGLSFGRVVRRIDPEVTSSSTVREVLRWLEPPNRGESISQRSPGCLVIYWNGELVLSADQAQEWLDTQASFFEGMEYYRHPYDAPLAFREIPIYLQDRVSCSVLALWPKTGYFGDPPPDLLPPQERFSASAYFYRLEGKMAPAPGGGVEVAGHVGIRPNLAVGLHVRATAHQLPASVVRKTLEILEDPPFVLTQGRRPFTLWAVGVEGRLTLGRGKVLRPILAGRFDVARRALSLVANRFGHPSETVSSFGAGLGLAAGVEALYRGKWALTGVVNCDWWDFEPYQELERAWYTTKAAWRGFGARVGIGYALGR